MSAYKLVDTAALLISAVSELRRSLDAATPPRAYLDTEFDSGRNGTSLCLLQISAGDVAFLIDPQRLKDLDPLRALLSDGHVEWILHAGLQDVELLCNALRLPAPERILDTQVAWSLLSPESSVGLSYLQFELLGIRTEKGHQADDWVRRPLQESQLRYAASDVAHLPKMLDILLAKARSIDRVEAIYAASSDALRPASEPPPPLTLQSFRNAWQLSASSQAALAYLMGWYNALPLGERWHAPEPKVLLSIASRAPEDVDALSRIKGVSRPVVSNYGQELVRGLRSAVQNSQAGDFVPLDPPPYCTYEEIRLDAWLANFRSSLAVSLGFAPEFVLPGRLMKRIKSGLSAEGTRGLDESLVGWRRTFLLASAQAFCETSAPPV